MQTYYCWRQTYGGMAPEMAKELKAIQKDNARLKKQVTEQALDSALSPLWRPNSLCEIVPAGRYNGDASALKS